MQDRSIHDPVHGTISLERVELAVVDSPAVQRLRFVKQLGFAEMAFPGATHSRFAHSLGAMHVAGLVFDEATRRLPLEAAQRRALRLALRVAVLLHDVGHPPLSHAAEAGMPALAALALGPLAPGPADRRARHEDYTLALVCASTLTDTLTRELGPFGVRPARIAALIAGVDRPPGAEDEALFRCEGLSLMPLLSAVVAGELDADRMDYLRRDAHFVGVAYGHFDHLWLTASLSAVASREGWCLGLHPRGIWALENFLLARYHMFLAVYHHHTAVSFDSMLSAWFAETDYFWPEDPEAYLAHDDSTFWQVLRASPSRWAGHLRARRPLSMVGEVRLFGGDEDGAAQRRLQQLAGHLRAAGLSPFYSRSDSALSRYARPGGRQVPLVVATSGGGEPQPVNAATPLYARFARAVTVERLFCRPEEREAARRIAAAHAASPQIPLT